jgi:hypothetical protein
VYQIHGNQHSKFREKKSKQNKQSLSSLDECKIFKVTDGNKCDGEYIREGKESVKVWGE